MHATLTRHLARAIDEITDRHVLAVVGFGEEGITVWIVRRDHNGTPYASRRPTVPWSALSQYGVLAKVWFRDLVRLGPADHVVYVATSAIGDRVGPVPDWLRSMHPTALTFTAEAPVAHELRTIIHHSAITRCYELVILRQARSGRLRLGRYPLFAPSAVSGDVMPLTVWCARSDELGTAFAVVSTERGAVEPQLISVHAAKVPPGRHEIAAELVEPAVVRFNGLPVELQEDHRPWSELVASVPERVDRAEPCHVVGLVEIVGTQDEVGARLDRLKQLLGLLAEYWDRPKVVSVVAYASHAIGYLEPDIRPRILTWSGSEETGLAAVEWLAEAGPARSGYLQSVQLECALGEVARRVDGDGRLVVITIGDRPPFPLRAEEGALIPCRYRYDWREAVQELLARPDTVFGLIKEQETDGEPWSVLGRDARLPLTEPDLAHFAAELGIAGPTDQRRLVFPFKSAKG